MNEPTKFTVMVFPNGLQGRLWSTILGSQSISTIWESPDVPLLKTLQASHRQAILPDLLILDTRLHHLQPLHLCRWCHKNALDLDVLLVNGAQSSILTAERQWAMMQGAADLLPRICRDSLMSTAAANLRRTLDLLDVQSLNQNALVSSLLKIGLNPQSRSSSQNYRARYESLLATSSVSARTIE